MPTPLRKTVLYVEDHPVNVLLMAAIVERRVHVDLVVATTGEEALRLAAGLNPDLLLLDLQLPDCHGAQLLEWLREVPGCAAPLAVAVTADVTFDLEHSGFCELWTKPLYVENVLARLDLLLGTLPDGQSRASQMEEMPDRFASPELSWH